MAKGYIIANISVTDAEAYRVYREKVPAVIAQHGGRFLVRGGAMEQVEGPPLLERMVVIEFDSIEAARSFYRSEAYAPLIAMRQLAGHGSLAIVEGAA